MDNKENDSQSDRTFGLIRIEHQYARKPIRPNDPNISVNPFVGSTPNTGSTLTQHSAGDSLGRRVSVGLSDSNIPTEEIDQFIPNTGLTPTHHRAGDSLSRRVSVSWSDSNTSIGEIDEFIPNTVSTGGNSIGQIVPYDLSDSDISSVRIDAFVPGVSDDDLSDSNIFTEQIDAFASNDVSTETPTQMDTIESAGINGSSHSNEPNFENDFSDQSTGLLLNENQPNSASNNEADDSDDSDIFEVETILGKRTYRRKVSYY